MRFVFLQTGAGLMLAVGGIQTAYIYVTGLDKGTSILLLILAVILIGAGLYLLARAGKKSDITVFKKLTNFRRQKATDNQALTQVLQKNNQLSKEWDKTIEKRDRLKMLEISTAAQAQTND